MLLTKVEFRIRGRRLRRPVYLTRQEGQSIAEYALILAFVVVPFIYCSEQLQTTLERMFERVVLELSVYVNLF